MHRLVLALLAMLVCLQGARATPVEWFRPMPAPQGSAGGLERYAVDRAAMARSLGRSTTEVRLRLPSGDVLVARQTLAEHGPVGLAAWVGAARGGRDGLTLGFDGEAVEGYATVRGRVYRISGTGDVATLADLGPMRAGGVRDKVLTPPGAAFVPRREPARAAATVRVGIVWTGEIPAGYGGASRRAKVNAAIAAANAAFRRSGVAITLQSAGILALPAYKAPGDGMETTLRQATAGQGAFASLAGWRNRVKADLVSVWRLRPQDPYCGIAWIGPHPDYAHSVMGIDCLPYAVFEHELGHNFGLRHDRYVEAPASASEYRFGFVNTQAKIRDIMSYENACAAKAIRCERVGMFSTATIRHRGNRIGIAAGKPGAADAARWLRGVGPTVGAFR